MRIIALAVFLKSSNRIRTVARFFCPSASVYSTCRISATRNWLACWSQMSIVCFTPVGLTSISTMFCVSRISLSPLRISKRGLNRALSALVGLKNAQ